MSLTLADGRQIASAPSELVGMKVGEEESVLGWTLGFGLIGYLASSGAEERARAARVDDYRHKEFPDVTLRPQQTAHGIVFFIPPPATPAFDQAVLTVRVVDTADQKATVARAPLGGLGYRGVAARDVRQRSAPPRGTLISATNPLVGEWSGTFRRHVPARRFPWRSTRPYSGSTRTARRSIGRYGSKASRCGAAARRPDRTTASFWPAGEAEAERFPTR